MILSLLLGMLLTDADLNNPLAEGVLDTTSRTLVVSQFPLADERDITYRPRKKVINGRQSLGVEVSAQSAVVIDVATGQVLFQKKSDYKGSIASLTKLMSALVFLDHGPSLDTVIVMQESDERAGAQPHVYRGEHITAEQLLYASLMSSDNNSTIALARSTGLSIDEFVSEMNKKALQLGLHNTTFADPTGLEEGNISTAFDVSRLIYHALQYDILSEITSQASYNLQITEPVKQRTIYNTDKLLESYINTSYSIKGGKTGYIPESGYCLGIEVQNEEGRGIVVVAMGSESNNDRFVDVKALTQWAFDNYNWE